MVCLSRYNQLNEEMILSLGLSPWLHSQLLPVPNGEGGEKYPSLTSTWTNLDLQWVRLLKE